MTVIKQSPLGEEHPLSFMCGLQRVNCELVKCFFIVNKVERLSPVDSTLSTDFLIPVQI